MLSLIKDPWLPVRCADGTTRRIRPAELTDEAIVGLNYPRPDLQGAGYQFLIGLLQTTLAPEDPEDWEEVWKKGLDRSDVEKRFAALAHAFAFGADKPAFMQDWDGLEGSSVLISRLLIDSPGEQTLKLNKDHFVKRGTVKAICPPCAAMALFTLQINAPSGGSGHRTGMRGGGPLTSLVESPLPNTALWRRLWLNILTQQSIARIDQPNATVFPWLASTRESKKGQLTTPECADPLQAYWSMPRRIEIDFSTLTTGACDLCGEPSKQRISHYTTQNYGVNYEGWQHPLTPHREQAEKKDQSALLLSIKGKKGGLAYKDWLGLLWLIKDKKNSNLPAQVVTRVQGYKSLFNVKLSLWCFGYDTDNMKVRCWYENNLPLPHLNRPQSDDLLAHLKSAVAAAEEGAKLLLKAVKEAWYQRPKDARGDFDFISRAFWQETEPAFQHLLTQLTTQVQQAEPHPAKALADWGKTVRRESLDRFDAQVLSSSSATQDESIQALQQAIKARQSLFKAISKKTSAIAKIINPVNTKEDTS